MAEKKLIKLADLEYNEQITLAIVEKDTDMIDIFMGSSNEKSFTLLRHLVKSNMLKPSSKESLRNIFDQVIMTTPKLIDDYKRLSANGVFEVTAEYKEPEVAPVPTVVEEVFEKTAEIVAEKVAEVKVKKPKAEGSVELPRRYGKEKIMADIQAQGGKSTPLQNAMLKVNDLKNIYVNLSARGIKDMVGGSKLISDEDSRKIVSAITIVERQLAEILKKK